MKPLTRAQRESLARLHRRLLQDRQPNTVFEPQRGGPSYRQFRRAVVREIYGDAIMVHYAGMWVGIEPDGYTHS